MLAVQVQVLLLRVRVRVVVAGTVTLEDLLLHLLEDHLRVHHLLVRVQMVGSRTMKAVADTQTLDGIILVRIREITTGTTRAGMHHRVPVVLMV
jgi:hypothetical protein